MAQWNTSDLRTGRPTFLNGEDRQKAHATGGGWAKTTGARGQREVLVSISGAIHLDNVSVTDAVASSFDREQNVGGSPGRLFVYLTEPISIINGGTPPQFAGGSSVVVTGGGANLQATLNSVMSGTGTAEQFSAALVFTWPTNPAAGNVISLGGMTVGWNGATVTDKDGNAIAQFNLTGDEIGNPPDGPGTLTTV